MKYQRIIKFLIGTICTVTATTILSISTAPSSNAADNHSNSNINSVNKTTLKTEIDKANAIKPTLSNYAKISQEFLTTATENGEKLIKNDQASQKDIDQQSKVLASAISGMIKKNENQQRYTSVPVGKEWLDTDGAPIQAHGGGFLQSTDTDGTPIYYWVGEDKSHNAGFFNGINLYSSKDLVNWTFKNTIVKPNVSNNALSNVIMERPKLLYNAKTKKYVLWAHWENQGNYSSSQVAIATSDTPDGNYNFVGHWRPGANATNRNWRVNNADGQVKAQFDKGNSIADYSNTDTWGTPSRDFTLFEDNGKAYIVSTENGTTMRIYELNSDFTDVDKSAMSSYELFKGARREAPAIVKAGNYYVLVSSQQSGWYPNQGRYSYTKNIADPNGWKVDKTTSSSGTEIDTPSGILGDNSTFHSQPTNIMKVTGNGQTNYIYMGDSWNPSELGKSSYVWLPLTITGLDSNSPKVSMNYEPSWSLAKDTGKIIGSNEKLLSKDMPVSTNQQNTDTKFDASKANDGDASNTFFKPLKVPYTYTIDLKSNQSVSRVDLSFRLMNGSETFSQYTIDTSTDGKTWTKQVDQTNNNSEVGFLSHQLTGKARYIRLSVQKVKKDKDKQEADWASGLMEMSVYGPKDEDSNDSPAPTNPNQNPTPAPSPSPITNPQPVPDSKPSPDNPSNSTTTTSTPTPKLLKKGSPIYATKKIALYRTTNFSKNVQIAVYPKRTRQNRPTFTILDYAKSKTGTLRYKVRDSNKSSKTYGKVGFLTANKEFVQPLYYSSSSKTNKVTVINNQGINGYHKISLKGKVKHYKHGAHLKVSKLVKYNNTSRYELTNGSFITANKKFIISGTY
ncbi:DUF5776 domain-containing protein [Lentilactobacillus sp. Marseille-Q4993]|uniref:DUF5776 domain-containing protein n=1 Tax=Lentilactobacillus sp. Marseille-Q4993 TaxID=3039492 RepID=UPI0024BD5C26|nr:DUF5776 domain-containing protein [Lentilactobacillus sp. Marseille-Q4993]